MTVYVGPWIDARCLALVTVRWHWTPYCGINDLLNAYRCEMTP